MFGDFLDVDILVGHVEIVAKKEINQVLYHSLFIKRHFMIFLTKSDNQYIHI